jgi:uncharacterized protein YcfL
MRKVVLSALCAAALLTACNNSGQNKSTLQAQNDSLMLELSNRDTELDEIMGAFNEIQEGFREINEAENRVDLKEGTLESQSAADKIKEDMRFYWYGHRCTRSSPQQCRDWHQPYGTRHQHHGLQCIVHVQLGSHLLGAHRRNIP